MLVAIPPLFKGVLSLGELSTVRSRANVAIPSPFQGISSIPIRTPQISLYPLCLGVAIPLLFKGISSRITFDERGNPKVAIPSLFQGVSRRQKRKTSGDNFRLQSLHFFRAFQG